MHNDEELKQGDRLVLINDEEQYCVWAAHLPIPNGWRSVGLQGSQQECAAYVDEHWTDMRPKSLRQALADR